MNLKNTAQSYGSVAKFFHWLIFLMLFCMVIFGFLLEDVPKDWQPVAFNIHKLIGLTILTLMMLRLLWALANIKPMLPLDMPAWQRLAARTVHKLLYLVVIAMPIAGWVGSAAAGRSPHLGTWILNLPVPQDKALSKAALMLHGTLAYILIALVSAHVLAALYHHFIRKDNVLRRMWW
jgi:cytochrome b561